MAPYTVTHECGYEKTSKTRELARYGLSKHSCDAQRKRNEVAARVAARLAYEGEHRDCAHKEADHQHGTVQAYNFDDCRCRPCLDAHAAACRHQRRQAAYGRTSPRIDADPVREHLARLADYGIGHERVARLTGLSVTTIQSIVRGKPHLGTQPQARIQQSTADKIYSIQPTLEHASPGARIPATGSVRRLQALAAIGYTTSDLARLLGMIPTDTSALLQQERITARKARKIQAIYDQHWNQPRHGTHAQRARCQALTNSWAPPLAWDDDTIDQPDAQPEGMVAAA